EDWMNCYLFLPENAGEHRLLNVVRGGVAGRRSILFDYYLRLEAGLAYRNPRPDREFTGVAAELGMDLPGFVMYHRTLRSSMSPAEMGHLGVASLSRDNDISFDDPVFADRYTVQGKDPAAVRRLFGPGLRRRLAAETRTWFVEGGGNWLVVYYLSDGKPRPPEEDLADAGRIAQAFSA
ncbi:MAG: hypothetical protein NTX64_14685, partial [Elusimicrobia bacterium]|nr:hypothetical protein [Elusimicrobiota bacterium]